MGIACEEAEVAAQNRSEWRRGVWCGPRHPLGCGLNQGQGQGIVREVRIHTRALTQYIQNQINYSVDKTTCITRSPFRLRSRTWGSEIELDVHRPRPEWATHNLPCCRSCCRRTWRARTVVRPYSTRSAFHHKLNRNEHTVTDAIVIYKIYNI